MTVRFFVMARWLESWVLSLAPEIPCPGIHLLPKA